MCIVYEANRYKVNNIIKCESLAKDTKALLGVKLPANKHAKTVASEHHKKHMDAYTSKKMKDTVYALPRGLQDLGYRK